MVRLLSIMACLLIPMVGTAVGVVDNGTYKTGAGATQPPAPLSDNIKLVPPPLIENLRVNIMTEGTRFHVGDSLPLQFAVNHKSYVWIFNTDPNGRTVQIFPNYFDRNNCLDPGKTYSIPDRNYQLTVTGPRGNNQVNIVAVSLDADYKYLDEWRNYSKDDPFPATADGAKGLMKQIDQMCKKNTVMIKSPQVLNPMPAKELYATKTAKYYVMEQVGGETAEYRVPRYGKFAVNSYPTNGRIYIDGQYVGRTPQMVERVAAGDHKVKVLKEGYTPYECTLTVTPNTVAQVEAFLKETPVQPGYNVFKKLF